MYILRRDVSQCVRVAHREHVSYKNLSSAYNKVKNTKIMQMEGKFQSKKKIPQIFLFRKESIYSEILQEQLWTLVPRVLANNRLLYLVKIASKYV